MVKILHFSDAHIDMLRQGRRDPQSGLPVRTLDFLRALDTIVESAIAEKVQLVIFAGDAYRNQLPAPTFQREWGKRILRLSQAGIFTILVVGNHDISPASGRAHALQEFETLQIPNTHVISEPCLLKPADLNGLPLQVIGLPWVSRSGLMAFLETQGKSLEDVHEDMETVLTDLLKNLLNELDPALPAVLTAHVTVQGAIYGNERSVMLGRDLVIPPGLLKDERLDYVALGHIHQHQNLNENGYPPIIYSGSIEKMDFGELHDQKSYIVAEVERKDTHFAFHKLQGRKFLSREVEIAEREDITETILSQMPARETLQDAIFRLVLRYPRKWEALIDERRIRAYAEGAFEFYLVRNTHDGVRVKLPEGSASLTQMPAQQLLELYWKAVHLDDEVQVEELQRMAAAIMHSYERGESAQTLLEEMHKKRDEA
jgi:exonuclease SbcD